MQICTDVICTTLAHPRIGTRRSCPVPVALWWCLSCLCYRLASVQLCWWLKPSVQTRLKLQAYLSLFSISSCRSYFFFNRDRSMFSSSVARYFWDHTDENDFHGSSNHRKPSECILFASWLLYFNCVLCKRNSEYHWCFVNIVTVQRAENICCAPWLMSTSSLSFLQVYWNVFAQLGGWGTKMWWLILFSWPENLL